MAARRGLSFLPIAIRAADCSALGASAARTSLSALKFDVSVTSLAPMGSITHAAAKRGSISHTLPRPSHSHTLLPSPQVSPHLRPVVPVRQLWNGWKLGFSSSTAAQQDDKTTEGKPAAEGAAAAGEEQQQGEGEAQAEHTTPEELQAALAQCQESLEAERKKVSTDAPSCHV
jgi:hypothetical protein